MLVGANCSTNLRHYDCERPNIAHGPSPPHAEAPPVVATVVAFAEWSVLFLACAVSWRWVASRRAASCWRTGLGGRVLTRCMVPLPLRGFLKTRTPGRGSPFGLCGWFVCVRVLFRRVGLPGCPCMASWTPVGGRPAGGRWAGFMVPCRYVRGVEWRIVHVTPPGTGPSCRLTVCSRCWTARCGPQGELAAQRVVLSRCAMLTVSLEILGAL